MKGWWVKMEIDEFTGHYIDMTDEEIVKDVRASVVDFIRRNPEGETFGAKMVRKMDDRIAERSEQNAINGKKGAEARWSRNSSEKGEVLVNQKRTGTAVPELRRAAHSPAPVRSSGPMPANVQEVYDFASLEGLDKDDAYECWYVTTAERDGNDADGNPVTNWKAFVRTWCNTRSKKRSA